MRKSFRVAACTLLLLLALCGVSLSQDKVEEPPPPLPTVDPFDSFGKLSWEDEQARLDNFAVAISTTPDWIGQIIVYAGRKSCAGEAQARAIRMKKYLLERRGIAWNRIIWRDAGHLEKPHVVFWLASPGNLLPPPAHHPASPDAKDVQIINCKSKEPGRRKQ
jgi:hypothetical protein